jgi:CTP synthase (UTP-ammonia lyase)
MDNAARIAIVGDFNPGYPTHHATNAALSHSAAALDVIIDSKWVATSCLARGAARILQNYDGLWIAPGSPYRSMDGAFEAIRFGRTQSWPLIGT